MKRVFTGLMVALAVTAPLPAALADEQTAINGCVNQLRNTGGPDAANGIDVVSSEFSEAATLVMLRDAGGTLWRCLAYSNGNVGELRVEQAADDGGGAMAGSESTTDTQRVQFARGSSGAVMQASLTPGSSVRYLLGAKNRQMLTVNVQPFGPSIFYQIFNPDGTALLDQIGAAQEYRGELWQSGDHVIEVINRGQSTTSFQATITIE